MKTLLRWMTNLEEGLGAVVVQLVPDPGHQEAGVGKNFLILRWKRFQRWGH